MSLSPGIVLGLALEPRLSVVLALSGVLLCLATLALIIAAWGRRKGSALGTYPVRNTERAVSQENVKLVRHLYESGLFDRDPEELLELATPDVEYVNPPYAVEPGVRHGLVAVTQAMRRFAEPWEESRHELRELYDRGDAVVAAVSWHIRNRGSEKELVNEEAHTWTLREGRIARFEWGQDLGTALENAGAAGGR